MDRHSYVSPINGTAVLLAVLIASLVLDSAPAGAIIGGMS